MCTGTPTTLMSSGCDGTFTCLYADNTSVDFAIPRVDFDIQIEEHYLDVDSQPIVDIHHQPDLVEKKGAWEVVHDKLYVVSQEGNLITIQASMLCPPNERMDCKLYIEHLYPDGSFFDDGMKRYREELSLGNSTLSQKKFIKL